MQNELNYIKLEHVRIMLNWNKEILIVLLLFVTVYNMDKGQKTIIIVFSLFLEVATFSPRNTKQSLPVPDECDVMSNLGFLEALQRRTYTLKYFLYHLLETPVVWHLV